MRRQFYELLSVPADRSRTCVLLILGLSALSILGFFRPTILREIQQAFGPDVSTAGDSEPSDAAVETPDVDPISLSDSDAVLVVRSDRIFTRRGVAALRAVVDSLEALPQVRRVLWMDRVPELNIFGLPEPLLPRPRASEKRFAASFSRAMQHPLVGGQLLSEDGRTILLLVSLDFDYVRRDADCGTILKQTAETTASSHPDVDLAFMVTGQVPVRLMLMETHESNQLKYQSIGYGVIVVMAMLLFRGIRPVLIVVAAPVTGLFWTLGLLQFLQLPMNPFNDVILPVLLLLVGFTDGVHLMVTIRKLRAGGLASDDAARTALRQVGPACFLTSLTTAIGFGSLSLARHEWVRDFGLCSVIGVSLMFIAVITIIPVLSSTWIGRRLHVGHDRSLIDRNLQKISIIVDAVLRRPALFSAMGITLTVLLTAGALMLRPDERRSTALPEKSEATRALRHMDESLGGLEFSSVKVSWGKDTDSDSPEILEVVSEVQDFLQREPLLNYPLSVRSLLDSLPGDKDSRSRMAMLELLPPPLKRAFFVPEAGEATVTFRVRDLGIARFDEVFTRLENHLRDVELRHPNFTLSTSGSAVWRWKNLYRMLIDLAISLGSAAVVILLVMTIAFRSVRIGLISIVPNIFPLAFTGTWLWVSGYPLELVSVLAFTVCLGIAVDDTIHFLTRYREMIAQTASTAEAVRRAFTGVGVALVMTTVVLVTGFATVAFSDSHDHQFFACMGGLTIASALGADLVFLPALLLRFAAAAPRMSDREE